MNQLIMEDSIDLDLEEIESRLYSQVFHSTENWDQNPDHPVLNKVPERQVTTYSINKPKAARYWDDKTQSKTPPATENAANTKTIENISKTSDITTSSDNDNVLQNNEKNIQRKVGLVEEYIGLNSPSLTNNQDENSRRNDQIIPNNIDFSKDDYHQFKPNFFCNSQNKLIQLSEVQGIHNTVNNVRDARIISRNKKYETYEIPTHLLNCMNELEKTNTRKSLCKLRKIRGYIKRKQTKAKRRRQRALDLQIEADKQYRTFNAQPNNNSQSFENNQNLPSNNSQSCENNQNLLSNNSQSSPIYTNSRSPVIEQIESPKAQHEIVNNVGGSVVISSDSDSDDVIEVPLPKDEIVCIDSSSENSDTYDYIDDIVEEMLLEKSITTIPNTEETNVPDEPKLENINDSETTEIVNDNSEIMDDTKQEDTEENKEETIEEMKNIEENATTQSDDDDDDEKIDESPNQNKNTSNTSINEIENERAELLCTPDSNTNDFMAHDMCNLNKSNNFCFNFNLHETDLDLSGKEISKAGPSNPDVYETESSCSEAGPTIKNRSYFNEVDFETPSKEIFAEPDLAKFSSFITPIRNRNISNVAKSSPELAPVKTKAGVVDLASFQVDVYQGKNLEDDYHSDPTTLPVKKKIKKKKKKKVKNKDTSEENNKTDDETADVDDPPKTPDNTTNKKKKKQRKSCTYADLKEQCYLDNQDKEKPLENKNKRKSGECGDEVNNSPNKKAKNTINTATKSPQKQNTNKDNIESCSETVSKPNENNKEDLYFADDILYKELNNENDSDTNSNVSIKTKNVDKNEIIDIDVDVDSNSDMNVEKFSFMNTFQKSNSNETVVKNSNEEETIDISSDSDTEIQSQANDESVSSNSGTNIVLNIFSPETTNNEGTSQNVVANPFSFVQNFEKLNRKKSFKDYLTNDMNTFYNESWGHEDYSVTAVQQSMPSDFSKWAVNTEDQYPVMNRRRGPMCLRCKEFGHIQFRCPKLREAVKCITCGDFDHRYTRCPRSICTTCRSSTQHHTTSCNKCSDYKTLRCRICNYIGHLPRDCPDLWRRYHLTTNDNNLLEISNHKMKPANMLWCSNCANRGHSANDCHSLRTDHFPTYPGILNYNPVYNNLHSVFQNEIFQPPKSNRNPEVPVRIFENVNLSQIRNHRHELTENNNKKYLNMIKTLRNNVHNKCDVNDKLHLFERLNYLQNAATNNLFNKNQIGELYKISKMLKNYR